MGCVILSTLPIANLDISRCDQDVITNSRNSLTWGCGGKGRPPEVTSGLIPYFPFVSGTAVNILPGSWVVSMKRMI